MSILPTPLTPALYAYYESIGFREHAVLRKIREDNRLLPQRNFQASPEVAHFLAFLIKVAGANHVLEIGTFTGYSTTAMALSLPPEGHITTCDLDEEITTKAFPYWADAGVSHKITLRLGNAHQTLFSLKEEGKNFDFIFIDANKSAYDDYYEKSLELLKKNGLIVLDNTLWHGQVQEKNTINSQTRAIQMLNKKIHQDPRVSMLMLPMSDGLTIVRKR